jgi:hypothetical protein
MGRELREFHLFPHQTEFNREMSETRERGIQSLSENWEGCCFRGKGWMARRDEGEYPSWVFD